MQSTLDIEYLLFQHYIYHLNPRLYNLLLLWFYGGVFLYMLYSKDQNMASGDILSGPHIFKGFTFSIGSD